MASRSFPSPPLPPCPLLFLFLLLFTACVSLSLSADWPLSLFSRFYVYEWDSFVNSVHAHRCTSRRSFSTHRLQSREREGEREWVLHTFVCLSRVRIYTFHTDDSTRAFQPIPMTKFKTSRRSDSSAWPCRRRRENSANGRRRTHFRSSRTSASWFKKLFSWVVPFKIAPSLVAKRKEKKKPLFLHPHTYIHTRANFHENFRDFLVK